jgi:NAD(P)H dehydrogenase (quinone)
MLNPKILVTGAAGKTGSQVTAQLLERGFPVRALVRKFDERSEKLGDLGAEVVVGDFLDLASIRRATAGVERVYFCYPPQGEQLVEATAIMAIAAGDQGIQALVNMSQISAREDARSPLSRQHWQSEKVFDWAGIGAVHVRPTFFAENLFMFGAQTIESEGKLYLPLGNEQHAPVAASDIARVITAILTNPAEHTGARYIITGPKNLTLAEMAKTLSLRLGRPVEYVDLPVEAWGDVLAGIPTMSSSLITHLKSVAIDHQNGIFRSVTDVVERIGGQPATPLDAFIQAAKADFGFTKASHCV